MIEIDVKSECSGCSACASVCPVKCIAMIADEEGLLYPVVDKAKCIGCGLCEKICPVKNRRADLKNGKLIAYAACNNNDGVRSHSSSGGVFTLIAEKVIDNGGVVFGAAFDENFNVKHRCCENKDGISAFRGSKYVQSDMGDSYQQVKEFLERGRLVLFTGTPCEIGGLYAYLNKNYDNLITQDFICHGVPSAIVWQKYLEYRADSSRGDIKNVTFRDKNSGWKTYSVAIDYADGSKLTEEFTKDSFMRAFLKDLCLRPSCYDCAFKAKKRQSDITLADFWGVEDVMPEMDDDKGTSLVFLNSEKGKTIFDGISSDIRYKEVDAEVAISNNLSMIESAPLSKKRDAFMRDIYRKPFVKTVDKYTKITILCKIKRKIERIVKRFGRK